MSSTGAGYDLSPTTFSPDGRIFQVEYASKAVENSSTALGVRCSDGIVLAVEKLLMSKLLVPGSNRRLQTVDKFSGMAFTGLVADGRQLVNRARAECSSFSELYDYHIPPDVLCNRLSEYVHYFTLHGSLRPFGSACILASYDEVRPRESLAQHPMRLRVSSVSQELKTHQLHMIEPSGLSFVRALLPRPHPNERLSTQCVFAEIFWLRARQGTAIRKDGDRKAQAQRDDLSAGPERDRENVRRRSSAPRLSPIFCLTERAPFATTQHPHLARRVERQAVRARDELVVRGVGVATPDSPSGSRVSDAASAINAKLDTCGIRALCRRTEAEETAKKELEDMDEDDD